MNPLQTYIDHTLLQATATPNDISLLCEEAMTHDFYAVCVNSYYTAFAKAQLQKSPVKIATVVGFPLAAVTTSCKVFETKEALKNGADEIDMVLHIGALKANDIKVVEKDIAAVREASNGHILKVIFENCYLSDHEKRIACKICLDNEVDFIKTSTGFAKSGATLDDIKLMKEEVKDRIKIKASGGIRDHTAAVKFIAMGADRLGTSASIEIIHP